MYGIVAVVVRVTFLLGSVVEVVRGVLRWMKPSL